MLDKVLNTPLALDTTKTRSPKRLLTYKQPPGYWFWLNKKRRFDYIYCLFAEYKHPNHKYPQYGQSTSGEKYTLPAMAF